MASSKMQELFGNAMFDVEHALVVAEICHDELPFRLCSDVVKPSLYHIAKHDLHEEASRKAFFHG